MAFSPLDTVYLGGGVGCRRMLFSNLTCKDVLANLRGGRGASWEIPGDISDDYRKQIDSEVKRRTESKVTKEISERWVPRSKGFPNHLWDCEVMQVAAALSQRLLSGPDIERTSKEPAEGSGDGPNEKQLADEYR